MEERAFWLAWSQIPGVGSVLQRRLQQHFGSLAEAWVAAPGALGEVEGLGGKKVETVVQARSRLNPAQFFEQHLQKNPNFWTPVDADYPSLLREIPNPPPVLYYRGIVDPRENQGITPVVGIVGTRKPSEYGIRWTRRISSLLAKRGFTIASGMAVGIDTEAHRACLDAQGRTLAIFGTHLDRVYPKKNGELYQRILKQGAVFSEYPSGTPTKPEHFAQRNRIIAGLSRAVLVMEAPERSGALITAHLANDFCRDVYALPGSLDNPKSHGCLELLENGAHQISWREDKLLEMLGAMPQLDAPDQLNLFDRMSNPPAAQVPQLPPELKQVLDAIAPDPTPFDAIVQQTRMNAASVSSALLQLELLGLVSQLPGMRYQRC